MNAGDGFHGECTTLIESPPLFFWRQEPQHRIIGHPPMTWGAADAAGTRGKCTDRRGAVRPTIEITLQLSSAPIVLAQSVNIVKVTQIKGKIEDLGEISKKKGGQKIYDHILFRDNDGTAFTFEDIVISDGIARFLETETEGAFVIGKLPFNPDELHAARVGSYHLLSDFLRNSLPRLYVSCIFFMMIAALFSVILIGIPFLIALIWGTLTIPFTRQRLFRAAEEVGINSTVPRPT